jgi:hypothetical protein
LHGRSYTPRGLVKCGCPQCISNLVQKVLRGAMFGGAGGVFWLLWSPAAPPVTGR